MSDLTAHGIAPHRRASWGFSSSDAALTSLFSFIRTSQNPHFSSLHPRRGGPIDRSCWYCHLDSSDPALSLPCPDPGPSIFPCGHLPSELIYCQPLELNPAGSRQISRPICLRHYGTRYSYRDMVRSDHFLLGQAQRVSHGVMGSSSTTNIPAEQSETDRSAITAV